MVGVRPSVSSEIEQSRERRRNNQWKSSWIESEESRGLAYKRRWGCGKGGRAF